MFTTAINESLELRPSEGRGDDRTPVRRHSRLAGHCEGLFWRRTSKQEAGRIRLAAAKYELATRQPGARNGAIGFVGLEVISYLTRLVDHRSGRLEPSIATLMQRLRRSKDAIVRALAALRRAGFIDWVRRFEPTGNEGKGPTIRQVSNAYRLALPPVALRLLGRLGQPAPIPSDHSVAVEARKADREGYRATLPLAQRALFVLDDGPLAQALAHLGREIQRESASRSESGDWLESMRSRPAGRQD